MSISTAATARARARRNLRNLALAAQAAATAAAHPAEGTPAPRGGRAWLNGYQLGGHDARYAGLSRAHD